MPEFDSENEAFEDIIKSAIPNKMISNFVLIAEVIDSDGEELSIFMSEQMTPWLALGMIKYGSHTVKSQSRSHFLEDE